VRHQVGFACFLASILASSAAAQCNQSKVASPFAPAGGRFGSKVDIGAGPVLIASAPDVEAVSIHRRVGDTWQLEATLGDVSGSGYGSDVAIEGSIAVVGVANRAVSGTNGAGAVEVWKYDGVGSWSFLTQVSSPAPQMDGNFGFSLALDGGWLVVGAPGMNAREGLVYAYQLDALGVPVLKQTLAPVPAYVDAGDEFGYALDVGLPGLAIGAPFAKNTATEQGSASTYRLNGAGTGFTYSNTWTLAVSFCHIGKTIAVDGDIALAGSPDYLSNEGVGFALKWNGAAYAALGTTMEYGPVGAKFFAAAAIHQDHVFIGVPNSFELPFGTRGFSEYRKFNGTALPPVTSWLDAFTPPEYTLQFAAAIAADDGLLAIGAPEDSGNEGVVYTYDLGKIAYDTDTISVAGASIKGTGPHTPSLELAGSYCDSEVVYIGLNTDLAATMSFLFVGLSDIQVPFKGGILVPAPDLQIPIPTNPTGDWVLTTLLPPGLPPALRLSMQCFIQDAGGPKGFAATPAYEAFVAH
jgi:hypothetical protein